MRRAFLLALLVLTSAACSTISATRDRVDTVNQAVDVIQAVDDRSAWEQIAAAADDLAATRAGYLATASLRASDTLLTWQWQVDTDGDQRLDITRAGALRSYLLPAASDAAYQVVAESQLCAADAVTASSLRAGVKELLELADFQAASGQVLAVWEKPQDAVIAGRAATRYALTPRLLDAVGVLDAYDDPHAPEVRAVAQTKHFSGYAALDDDTGALLELSLTIEDSTQQTQTELHFELTQWGGVTDIPRPAETVTIAPCD